MVERYVRDVEAASSNLVTSTKIKEDPNGSFFILFAAATCEVAQTARFCFSKTAASSMPPRGVLEVRSANFGKSSNLVTILKYDKCSSLILLSTR